MDDLISRENAINAMCDACGAVTALCSHFPCKRFRAIESLPSAEPTQGEMIKEIRKWINSGNRGKADYFIVDKIEEIIRNYE